MTNTPKKNDATPSVAVSKQNTFNSTNPTPSAAATELSTVNSTNSTPRSGNPSLHQTFTAATRTPEEVAANDEAKKIAEKLGPISTEEKAKVDGFYARAYNGNGFNEEKLKELKKNEEAEQGKKVEISSNKSPSRSTFSLFNNLHHVVNEYMASKALSKN